MTSISFSKINADEINCDEPIFDPFSKLHISLFGKPIEIGHFSIDANKEQSFDKSQMKYLISNLKTENLNLDLNANCSLDKLHKYITIDKLHKLLRWIIHQNYKPSVDFITVRGTLTRIMCTPYTAGFYRNKWEMCASKYKDTIYISAIDTEDDGIDYLDPMLLQFQSWGYKFEQYLTTNEINDKPVLRPFNNHEEFCIVLKNKFNNFTLLYQAEIDGKLPYFNPTAGPGDTSCYVELKTSRIISRTSDLFKFYSQKFVIWWAQSFLTGISDIICGRRTHDGIVKFLEIYNVNDIPVTAYGIWSSEACLNFCDRFLRIVKKTVKEDNPNIVYKFIYDGAGKVNIRRLINPEDKHRVIPDWYKKAMDKLENI